MKWLLILFSFLLLLVVGYYFYAEKIDKNSHPVTTQPASFKKENRAEEVKTKLRLKSKAEESKKFLAGKSYSIQYVFLSDMRIPSGKKRFFVYDLQKDSVIHAGLVAHGSCRAGFLEKAQFANIPECGCSSLGKYKIGYAYEGQFGQAFKLYGLDSTNSKAFERFIVLHAYNCVPDEEVYPLPICNSLGCPMVSYTFLEKLKQFITTSRKPILLWIY